MIMDKSGRVTLELDARKNRNRTISKWYNGTILFNYYRTADILITTIPRTSFLKSFNTHIHTDTLTQNSKHKVLLVKTAQHYSKNLHTAKLWTG